MGRALGNIECSSGNRQAGRPLGILKTSEGRTGGEEGEGRGWGEGERAEQEALNIHLNSCC